MAARVVVVRHTKGVADPENGVGLAQAPAALQGAARPLGAEEEVDSAVEDGPARLPGETEGQNGVGGHGRLGGMARQVGGKPAEG